MSIVVKIIYEGNMTEKSLQFRVEYFFPSFFLYESQLMKLFIQASTPIKDRQSINCSVKYTPIVYCDKALSILIPSR